MSVRDLLSAASGAITEDPYFYNVSLLLTGDGTNGAQNNTFLDSSTNNFTITRNGNTTQGTFSPYGNLWSNYFDGSGDYLSFTGVSLSSDFCLETWVYKTGNKASYSVLFGGPGDSGTNNTQLIINNSGGVGLVLNATSIIPSSGALALNNQWNHIVACRSGSNCAIFVNGTRVGTGTSSASSTVDRLGEIASVYGDTYKLIGYLSNSRIVTGSSVYNPSSSTITVPTTPLTAVSGTSLLTCQSNRFIDNSSNNFTLTVNGNTSVQRFSPFNPTAAYSAATIGGSGYFDGSGDYLRASYNSALDLGSSNFTIESFVYKVSTTDSGFLCGLATGATSGRSYYLLATTTPTFYWYYNGSTANTLTSSISISVGSWNHIAVVRNGSTITMYVNGISAGSASISGSLYSNATSVFDIGQEAGFGTYFFNGYASNLRVVKGTAVYTSNFTPPTAPLTAITNTSLLLNCTNAGIIDNAGKNDIETVGNAQISTSVKKYGTGSMYFDGTGDWLSLPASILNDFGTGNFTVEFWLYHIAFTNAYITIYDNNYATSTNLLIQQSSSGIMTVYINGTLNQLTSSVADSTGVWVHYAVVRNGTAVTLYRNGTSVASATFSGIIGNGTVPLYICGGPNGGGKYVLNGYIDDLRITKGLARYTANFTPPTSALPTY